MSLRWIRVYVIPGAVFQSVIFGGAYGTGREVVEFISRHGPIGGLYALGIIAIGFSLIAAMSFELARLLQAYDYRSFFKPLLGQLWFLFEILFLVGVLLVLAVNGSAAGEILLDQFGLPSMTGTALLFGAVVVLNYLGRSVLENSMGFWMVCLSLVLLWFCLSVIREQGPVLHDALTSGVVEGAWPVSGFQYTLYNVAALPVLIFCARSLRSRSEAAISGIIAGLLGVLPAVAFHVTFMAAYPAILEQPLPTYWLMERLVSPALFTIYIVILFGLMIQTVAGLLHGLNERLDRWAADARGTALPALQRALVSAAVLMVSLLLARFGIVALIAQGYGYLAWGYLLVFILPLMTRGLWLITRARS